MTFGSLFAGIGGLDLGFHRADWECRWQVEIDPFCRQVLAKQFPGVKQFEDITTTPTASLEDVDCIVGGFPCQDLSQAGKRDGIVRGSRSRLWFEFARVIGDLRPKHVVIENVPGLLIRDQRSGYAAMSIVVGELARLGYVGVWRSLRAAEFGASHLRKRVFIIAQLPGVGLADTSIRFDRSERAQSDLRGLQGLDGGDPGELANGEKFIRGREQIGIRGSAVPAGISGSSGDDCRAGGTMADTGDGQLQEPWRRQEGRSGLGPASADVSDSNLEGLPDSEQPTVLGARRSVEGRNPEQLCGAFAPGPSDPRWPAILTQRPDLAPAIDKAPKPAFRELVDGLPAGLDRALENRTKRLRVLGNAVVPQIAEWIALRLPR